MKKINSLTLPHPIRIGVDGITASGKTTFTKALSDFFIKNNHDVIYTTLDGFHNPGEVRHAKGKKSPEGYYWDAYNYHSIINELLLPLGPNGSLEFRTEVFDLSNNSKLDEPFKKARKNSLLLVDGSFSLREKLRDFWDFKIYLKVDFEVALHANIVINNNDPDRPMLEKL